MLGPQQWGLFFYRGVFSRLRGAWWRRFLSLCSQPYEERLDHDAPVSACVHAKVPALAKKLIFARFSYRVCGCITARMAFEGSMATVNVVHSRHRQFQRLNVDGKGRHIAQLLTFLPERTGRSAENAKVARFACFLFKLTTVLCIYVASEAGGPVPRAQSHRLPDVLGPRLSIERMMDAEHLAASTLPVA
mgnify:FL=1